MNIPPSTHPLSAPPLVQTNEFRAPAWIAWWYRLTTPLPPTDQVVSLKTRERIRRSRLASIILAVQLLLIEGPVVPIVAHAPNAATVLPWLYGCIAALLVAFWCNRRGYLTAAGFLMVGSIETTMLIKILTIPGGLSLAYLPQLDVLIQPIFISIALLSPWSAFAVAG